MARDDLHIRLRIPGHLKQKVEYAAANSHRSITAEMVARLEDSFSNSPDIAAIVKAAVKEAMEEATPTRRTPVERTGAEQKANPSYQQCLTAGQDGGGNS